MSDAVRRNPATTIETFQVFIIGCRLLILPPSKIELEFNCIFIDIRVFIQRTMESVWYYDSSSV